MTERSLHDSSSGIVGDDISDSVPGPGPSDSAIESDRTVNWIRKTIARANVKIWEWHEGNHYLTIGGRPSQILHLDPSKKSVVGPAFFPAPLGDDLDVLVAQLNLALESDLPFEVDLRLPTVTDNVLWLSCRGGRIKDESGPETVVGTLVDITPRKCAEEELRDHKESLEDLVRERTIQLFA